MQSFKQQTSGTSNVLLSSSKNVVPYKILIILLSTELENCTFSKLFTFVTLLATVINRWTSLARVVS